MLESNSNTLQFINKEQDKDQDKIHNKVLVHNKNMI